MTAAARSSRWNASRWPGSALLALSALAGVSPLAGCQGGCPALETCDIRRSGCQAHTAEVATCLTGDATVRPAVLVVDATSYIDEQIASDTGAESDDERDQRRGLALLSLMPSELDAPQVERDYWDTIAAFYDPLTAQVTVLDRGQALDDDGSAATLLHEMIHALQYSREPSYPEPRDDDDDGALALKGILEGEAVLYQDLAEARGFGFDAHDIDWHRVFADYQARSWSRVVESSAAYLMAWRYFPYAFGGSYVRDAWSQGGNAAVRELFSAPPASTRQILAGQGALPPAPASPEGVASWREDPDAVGLPVLPAQYAPVTHGRLGAWLFEIFKQRRLRSASTGLPLGAGLLGDVLSVFREPATGDVSIFWRLRFDSAAQAAALRGELEGAAAAPELGHGQYDRDVVLGASTRGPLSSELVQGLSWQPVPAPGAESRERPAALARRLTGARPLAAER